MTQKDQVLIYLRESLCQTNFITFSEVQKQQLKIYADIYAICQDTALVINLNLEHNEGTIRYINLYSKNACDFSHTFNLDTWNFDTMLKESLQSFISHWASDKLRSFYGNNL